MGRLGVLALLVPMMGGAGLAQAVTLDATPPSRAQVLTLMSAMTIRQNVEASLQGTQNKIKLAARTSFLKKNPNADEATLKKLDVVFDSTKMFTFDEISESLVPAYQKNLSASDVQAGIDFYSSDAGKRLLEKLPVILRESNESGGQLVQQKLKAYSDEVGRKLAAFQADVDKTKPAGAEKSKTADDKSKTDDESKTTDDKSK
jgi:uncharacterized protein